MATCDYCGGHGHTSIRNGDDDVTCAACKGSGEGVTAAAPEPLSAVAQIRLQFDKYQNAIAYRHILKSFYANQEIEFAKRELVGSAEDKIQALLIHIDAQAAEIARLKVELEAACGIVNAMCGTIVRDVK